MFFLENSTSNFNFHTEEMMPENNKRTLLVLQLGLSYVYVLNLGELEAR